MTSLTPLRPLVVFVFLCFVVFACKNDDEVKPNDDRVLVSAESVLDRSASEMRSLIGTADLDLDLNILKYDVEIFKITYKTKYNGQDIVASALVSLPKNAPSAPIVSFQHGTISAYSQAPTALQLYDPESVLYSALASPGFISVAPDFIGFGSAKSVIHPYYVEDITASTVRDAIRAARDLASDENVAFNGKLFLAGYSEGGYATMATHKSIEADDMEGIQLVASFPASGGYDIRAMQEYFWGLEEYEQPFYLAFVAQAYKTTFGWSEPLTDMFNEPYATRIPALLDGSKTNNQINAQLTTSISDLVTADALASLNTNSKYKYIVDAFADNSLVDWKPTIPIHMFHGDADVTVPFGNSQITYDKLITNGASSSIVTFTSLPGATHYTGIFPYLELVLPQLIDAK